MCKGQVSQCTIGQWRWGRGLLTFAPSVPAVACLLSAKPWGKWERIAVYRSSPPLVRSVSLACKHVDAGCLCLLPCRSLACCKPANRSLRDFPSCLGATERACRSFQIAIVHHIRFHCETTIRKDCVSSVTLAIHIASDILGESLSAVRSITSDTACSKSCTSLLASISNPNSSGRTDRAQHQLHTLPSCQKRRPCHSLNSFASGEQPVCYHTCDHTPYHHSFEGPPMPL